MKFLVDMNLSPSWLRVFADAGFEAVHWSQVGPVDATDVDLMAWAGERGYVVVTSDLDFGAILAATGRAGPSVLQIRGGTLAPAMIGADVLRAIAQGRRELLEGAIVSVEPGRARLRVLPLAGR
jgi:predicted nuclease of predicted toxin-antitoxin system